MTSANCNMAAAPLRELEPRTTEKLNRRTKLANQAPSRLALMRAAPCRCEIKRRMAKGSRRRRLCQAAPMNRSETGACRIFPRSSISKRMVCDQTRSRRKPNAIRMRAQKLSGSSFKFAAGQLVDFASGMLADWAIQVDRECDTLPYRRFRWHFWDHCKRMG